MQKNERITEWVQGTNLEKNRCFYKSEVVQKISFFVVSLVGKNL